MLHRRLEQILAETFRLLDRRVTLENRVPRTAQQPAQDMPVRALLMDLLRHRQALSTERLFRLVGLLYPSEDARSLYRGVHDPSPVAGSCWNICLPPLQGAVLALVDDIADTDRMARAHPYYVPPKLGYLEALSDLLDHGDAGTVGLVAYHIAEIGAVGLAPRLERLRASPDPAVVTALRHALREIGQVTTDGQ